MSTEHAEPIEEPSDPAAVGEPAPGADESLQDEGDIAADYIEELLDICDLDGDIDIESADGRTRITVAASADSNVRVLANAEAVAALQELTRLAVQAKTGGFSRLILDIGGTREARQRELAEIVAAAEARLDAGASRHDLEPMSSYERKLVHDLAAERGLTSHSEGEGRDRHTVITRA